MKIPENRFRFFHSSYPWLLLLALFSVVPAVSANTLHHDLQITLDPDRSRITVVDSIQFPPGTSDISFALRKNLTVKVTGATVKTKPANGKHPFHYYQLSRLPADGKVQISYQGEIKTSASPDQFGMPDVVLDNQAIYLDGSSAWFPRFSQFDLFSFNLKIEIPTGWEIISQGKRSRDEHGFTYSMPHPQNDIYLVGGKYRRYAQMHGNIELEVYLLKQNESLAQQYLENTAAYIDNYSNQIGAYPYSKFAVVENRWQTGYGMPSFTLLGSKVIRLPFILYTSLPHEILHNWWGNGVFIDFSSGNWSEGLTAYLADHSSNQQQGRDNEYRRKALERYANFAAKQRDFPLADFNSRHDEASQAIGYSKSLMLFHMLKKQLGDVLFDKNIKRFWQRYRFKPATFTDLIRQLLDESEIDFTHFGQQWLFRSGAPEISLKNVKLTKDDPGYVLTLEITQQQENDLYSIPVPVQVQLQDAQQPANELVKLSATSQQFTFAYKQRPLSVSIDPAYDIFRLLHTDERPASLGRLFGNKKQLLVYPADATSDQVRAWEQLAASWEKLYRNVNLVKDSELKKIPEDTAVWLLGWKNRLLEKQRKNLSTASKLLLTDKVYIDGQQFNADKYAVILLAADNSATGFIGAENPETIQKLARKLPHYNSYGVLVFSSPAAKNILKQHLPVSSSLMTKQLHLE